MTNNDVKQTPYGIYSNCCKHTEKMFKYIKKEYQFTDNVESLRITIKKAVDNSTRESTCGVFDKDDSFWIRDKHNFSFKSFPSIPTKIYGKIISENGKSIISIRIVPEYNLFLSAINNIDNYYYKPGR